MSPVIYTPPTPHKCNLPYVTRAQPQIHLVPEHPEGTIWKCDDCWALWQVNGRQSEEDRRAGRTALSTEWVRVQDGYGDGGFSDDLVDQKADQLIDQLAQHSEGSAWFGGPLEATVIDGTFDMRAVARAALEAALTPKENEA